MRKPLVYYIIYYPASASAIVPYRLAVSAVAWGKVAMCSVLKAQTESPPPQLLVKMSTTTYLLHTLVFPLKFPLPYSLQIVSFLLYCVLANHKFVQE